MIGALRSSRRLSSRLSRQRPDPSARGSRVAAIALVIIAGLSTVMAPSARAQAFDPDEVQDLRVSRSGTDIALAWQAPPTAPDGYIVRRCTLAALRGGLFGAPYFGNCVATGVLSTTWSEVSPAGAVFYLVSGQTAGVEGSLGSSWNGQTFVPRSPTDCASPEMPLPLTLVISLDTPQQVCGTEIRLSFPPEDLTYISSACSGLQTGYFGGGSEPSPGRVIHTCASFTGTFGSGEVTRVEFQRADCPIREVGIHVVRCMVLVGNSDCSVITYEEQTCVLDLQ